MKLIPGTRTHDLTGMVFGRLIAIEWMGITKGRNALWRCVCECKNEVIVVSRNLKSGHTKSCSCYQRECVTTHGISTNGTESGDCKHSLYDTWRQMMMRCLNPNAPNYSGYGGRGITIWNLFRYFQRWLEYIEEELGPRPKGFTLDRIDNDGHYAPGNLKWSDAKTQRRNQRKRAKELAERIQAACDADCTGNVERG